MDEAFQATLGEVLHGESRLGAGRTLAVDSGHGAQRLRAVEMHELVHEELSDNSCFGTFQQILIAARNQARGQRRARLDSIVATTMTYCFDTQEGAATIRELAWITNNLERSAADTYMAELPERYSRAFNRYVALLGDPREIGYLDLPPVVYHVILVSLGIANMGSPVLRDFTDPASLLASDKQPDLSSYSPDSRLSAMEQDPSKAQEAILEALAGTLEAYNSSAIVEDSTSFLLDAMDRTIHALRKHLPNIEWMDNADRAQQTYDFRNSWSEQLQGTMWFREGPMQTERFDLTSDAGLAGSFSRLNQGPHEGIDLPAHQAHWDVFVAAHAYPVPRVFRLVSLATDPPQVSDELVSYCTVLLQSVPMSTQAIGRDSPVVRTEPVILSESPMEQFAAASAEPWDSPLFYYSDVTRIDQISRTYPGWRPWTIRKCSSPMSLLEAIDEIGSNSPIRYTRIEIDHIDMFLIWVDRTATFCLSTPAQVPLLAGELSKRGAVESDRIQINISGRFVSMDAVARVAYWGFVGK